MTEETTMPYDFVFLASPHHRNTNSQWSSPAIDREDAAYLRQHRWRLSSDGYAVRDVKEDGKTRTIRMHREIMDPPEGMVVDRINRDKLNNLSCNFRLVTVSQNNANSAPRQPGKYRGVYWVEKLGKYRVKLTAGGTSIHVGVFDDEHEAGRAYNEAALKHHSEFARLNETTRPPTSHHHEH